MLIANFTTQVPTMGNTRTYEDFYKFLGVKPARLGIVANLYPQNTAEYLTTSLKNVIYNNTKSGNKFQRLNSLMYEYEIQTNQIKRIEFAAAPTEDGANGTEITFAFKENYYQKYDIFMIEESRQQVICITRPQRRADSYWEIQGRLIDDDYSSVLDKDACQIGMLTRFQSNSMPEMHEEGYCKYQSNISRFRGYITQFRNDETYSALYAAMEDTFVNISQGKGNGAMQETVYKMDKKEKVLLENFMFVKNNGLLFNKSSIDKNGKSTIQDPTTGRPIYIGPGLIPQIEAYADKYAYNKMTVDVLNTIVTTMAQKANSPKGNKWVFVMNEKADADITTTLGEYLQSFHTDGTFLYSMKANGEVEVGAKGYTSYNYLGNTLVFTVDRAFSREYGNEKGFIACIDLSPDDSTGKPGVAQFTFKNGEFIQNKVLGVGGADGLSSGEVSSAIAASKLIVWGYGGIGVFNPYKSFIAREV